MSVSGASEGLLRHKLAGSGDLLAASDLVGSSPSLVSFEIGTGDAGLSDGILGRYVYQRSKKSGWLLVPTCSGGLFPLRVESSSGELGSLAILEALDSLSPGDVMAGGYLVQRGRSASRKHIDVLLLVAMKNCDVSSLGRSSASSCTLGVSPLQPLV